MKTTNRVNRRWIRPFVRWLTVALMVLLAIGTVVALTIQRKRVRECEKASCPSGLVGHYFAHDGVCLCVATPASQR